MNQEAESYNYIPLSDPIPLTEQQWPEGTLPLVTTRTVTYMHEPFIRACIEGILMQRTTFPVQVVIHDDASTDKTADIVREYETKYPWLIKGIYQKENQYSKPGRGTMREDIHTAIRGKYVAYCEGDDYWTDPLKLQKQVEMLETNSNYSGCFHKTIVVSTDGTSDNPNDWWKDFSGRQYISFKDVISEDTPFHTSSFMFRGYLIKYLDSNHKLYKGIISGDLINFCLVANCGNIGFIHDYMSAYRRHGAGITTTTTHTNKLSFTISRIKMWVRLKNKLYPKEKDQFNLVISKFYSDLIKLYIHHKSNSNLNLEIDCLIYKNIGLGSLVYVKYKKWKQKIKNSFSHDRIRN
jgi:glycosyltransferase involved in cell wall biosynthesis